MTQSYLVEIKSQHNFKAQKFSTAHNFIPDLWYLEAIPVVRSKIEDQNIKVASANCKH